MDEEKKSGRMEEEKNKEKKRRQGKVGTSSTKRNSRLIKRKRIRAGRGLRLVRFQICLSR